MLWVLVGLLVVIVSILVTALQKVMNSVISRRYVPPSDAIIDQVMPEEILEHIFSFTDPLTLQRCSNVSRYWRSHASKNHVKTAVVERYVNAVRNSDYVCELVAQFGDGFLRKYPANYSVDNRLYDMAMAEKRGKQLLEVEFPPQAYHIRGAMANPKNTSYIIKSSATLISTPRFRIGPHSISSATWHMAPVLSFDDFGLADKNVKYDVMLSLSDYCNENMHEANFLMVRNLTAKKSRFGFIPLDDSFLKALAFLFIPLIVHDVQQSEPFMNLLKFWAGPITVCVLTFVVTREDLENLDYAGGGNKNAKLYKILVISTAVAVLIGFVLLYPTSSTHWAFLGLVLAASSYVWMLCEYVFGENFGGDRTAYSKNLHQFKTKERKQLMYVCAALVLLMNDWSATVRSFNDGTIWYRLLWNTVHYMGLPIYAIWNNVMACILADQQHVFRWKYFIDWDSSLAKQFVYFYGSAVLITLYAPYWQGNH